MDQPGLTFCLHWFPIVTLGQSFHVCYFHFLLCKIRMLWWFWLLSFIYRAFRALTPAYSWSRPTLHPWLAAWPSHTEPLQPFPPSLLSMWTGLCFASSHLHPTPFAWITPTQPSDTSLDVASPWKPLVTLRPNSRLCASIPLSFFHS